MDKDIKEYFEEDKTRREKKKKTAKIIRRILLVVLMLVVVVVVINKKIIEPRMLDNAKKNNHYERFSKKLGNEDNAYEHEKLDEYKDNTKYMKTEIENPNFVRVNVAYCNINEGTTYTLELLQEEFEAFVNETGDYENLMSYSGKINSGKNLKCMIEGELEDLDERDFLAKVNIELDRLCGEGTIVSTATPTQVEEAIDEVITKYQVQPKPEY